MDFEIVPVGGEGEDGERKKERIKRKKSSTETHVFIFPLFYLSQWESIESSN